MNRWISTTLPGTPPSLNELPLDTRNNQYRRARDAWITDACYAFNESGNKLPRNLATIRAHAVLTFPTNRRRDSGNYKAHLEKWLGDALQMCNRLTDDTHDVYSFGEVIILVEPGIEGHFLVIDHAKGRQ